MPGPWYIDTRIANGDESDAFDGGYGSGKLRNLWSDVTWTAGDRYYHHRAGVWNGALGRVTINATGVDGSPIYIGAYGEAQTDKAIWDGAGTRDIGLFATNHAYINLEDLEFRNYLLAGPYFGTSTTANIARFINMRRLYVHDIVGAVSESAGIRWWGSDVLLEDSVIERIGDDGIWFDGKRATIRRNRISYVSYLGRNTGDNINVGGQYCDGLVIHDNDLDHLFNDDKQIIVIIGSAETAATMRITNNRMIGYVTGAGAVSISCATDTAGGAVYRNNILHSNRGLSFANADTNARNMVVESNEFVGIGDSRTNDYHALLLLSAKSNGNTFANFSRGASVGDGEVKNSAFVDIVGYDYNGSVGANLKNNVYWNVGSHAPTADGADNRNVYPKMSLDYRPMPGSPLLSGGTGGIRRDVHGVQGVNFIGCHTAATLRRIA